MRGDDWTTWIREKSELLAARFAYGALVQAIQLK